VFRWLLVLGFITAAGALAYETGARARDAAGNPQAWFDPSQPVTVRLARLGGKSLDATGALPLHRSMVDGDREYRLSIVAAPRGFAQVTLERCRFP
jgi:hypothetical protein